MYFIESVYKISDYITDNVHRRDTKPVPREQREQQDHKLNFRAVNWAKRIESRGNKDGSIFFRHCQALISRNSPSPFSINSWNINFNDLLILVVNQVIILLRLQDLFSRFVFLFFFLVFDRFWSLKRAREGERLNYIWIHFISDHFNEATKVVTRKFKLNRHGRRLVNRERMYRDSLLGIRHGPSSIFGWNWKFNYQSNK